MHSEGRGGRGHGLPRQDAASAPAAATHQRGYFRGSAPRCRSDLRSILELHVPGMLHRFSFGLALSGLCLFLTATAADPEGM